MWHNATSNLIKMSLGFTFFMRVENERNRKKEQPVQTFKLFKLKYDVILGLQKKRTGVMRQAVQGGRDGWTIFSQNINFLTHSWIIFISNGIRMIITTITNKRGR